MRRQECGTVLALVTVMLDDIGERLMAGDPAAVAVVLMALRASGGDVGRAAGALGVSYQVLAGWWRLVPEIDEGLREIRKQ